MCSLALFCSRLWKARHRWLASRLSPQPILNNTPGGWKLNLYEDKDDTARMPKARGGGGGGGEGVRSLMEEEEEEVLLTAFNE